LALIYLLVGSTHGVLKNVDDIFHQGIFSGLLNELKRAMTSLTPKSLKLLNLQGCLVTIDAMGYQKKIAASVLHEGADYPLSVKDNRPKLVKAFEQAFPAGKMHEKPSCDGVCRASLIEIIMVI
jgi:hypothetical protein